MLIEQEFRNVVLGLSSIPDANINYIEALEKQTVPYITMSKVSSPRSQTLSGRDGMAVSRIQVNVYQATYDQAKTSASELYAIADHTSETIANIKLDNEFDTYDSVSKQFGVMLDFLISHYE